MRFTANSVYAVFASAKWHMPANFQVSPRVLGNNNDVGPTGYRDEKGESQMTMTDPIADMLTRVRNANSAHRESVSMPHSKMKEHIAEILKREGYIADFEIAPATVGKTLSISLKYGPNRERSIAGVRRVSKPGLRVYAKSTALPRVLGGLGVAIISTSTGLMTDKQCAQKGVGGEVLAYVW
jgi:small subunit ribosomal protein S8